MEIIYIAPLRHKRDATEKQLTTQSITVTTHDAGTANECIKHPLYRQLLWSCSREIRTTLAQFYKWQRYGHCPYGCKSRCVKCSCEEHPATKCKSEISKCAHCA